AAQPAPAAWLLGTKHKDEPSLVAVICKAGRFGRIVDEDGAGRLRICAGVECELEVASLAGFRDGGEHADDVAVTQSHASRDAFQRGSPPQEGPVDAAAVHDEPLRALALEGAVARASDQPLRVRLEGDVVGIGVSADGYA